MIFATFSVLDLDVSHGGFDAVESTSCSGHLGDSGWTHMVHCPLDTHRTARPMLHELSNWPRLNSGMMSPKGRGTRGSDGRQSRLILKRSGVCSWHITVFVDRCSVSSDWVLRVNKGSMRS